MKTEKTNQTNEKAAIHFCEPSHEHPINGAHADKVFTDEMKTKQTAFEKRFDEKFRVIPINIPDDYGGGILTAHPSDLGPMKAFFKQEIARVLEEARTRINNSDGIANHAAVIVNREIAQLEEEYEVTQED